MDHIFFATLDDYLADLLISRGKMIQIYLFRVQYAEHRAQISIQSDDHLHRDFHLQPGGYLSKSSHEAANYKSRETKAGDQSVKNRNYIDRWENEKPFSCHLEHLKGNSAKQ